MGMPLMEGPPPQELAGKFRCIKVCLILLIGSLLLKLVSAVMLGLFLFVLTGSVNVILNAIIGIFLLNSDPLFKPIYECLVRTFCSSCADQCPGGLTCLCSYFFCNLITVVLNLLIGDPSDADFVYSSVKEIMVPSIWTDNIVRAVGLSIFTVSMLVGILSQLIGAVAGFRAFNQVQASASAFEQSGGGDWQQGGGGGGGGGYPSAPPAGDVAPAQRPAPGFQPFAGQANRLGG